MLCRSVQVLPNQTERISHHAEDGESPTTGVGLNPGWQPRCTKPSEPFSQLICQNPTAGCTTPPRFHRIRIHRALCVHVKLHKEGFSHRAERSSHLLKAQPSEEGLAQSRGGAAPWEGALPAWAAGLQTPARPQRRCGRPFTHPSSP